MKKTLKYFSECPYYAPTVKRWQMLLTVGVIILVLGVIIFFPIDTGPSKEQIAQHKALRKGEIDKVTKFIEFDVGLSNEEAKKIAIFILDYYWDWVNPKKFRFYMVTILGRQYINKTTGYPYIDKVIKELENGVKQELLRSGLDPRLAERKERMTFRVEFIINENYETDVINVYLPSYDIERVNTR